MNPQEMQNALMAGLDGLRTTVISAIQSLAKVETRVLGLGDELARLRKTVHGNGDPSASLLSRQTKVELQLEELRKSLEERVPRVAALKGVPIYWWLVGLLLAIVVGLIILLAASKGLVDADAVARDVTAVVIEAAGEKESDP